MPLTAEEVRKILEDRTLTSKTRIQRAKAVEHEDAVRMHSESALEFDTRKNPAFSRFLRFVEQLLPVDKYRMFLTLVRFPLATVSFTDTIYTTLSKVFDGRNPVFDYQFTDPYYAQDWSEYQEEELGGSRFWQDEGFEVMKTKINSVMIVDLPEAQVGPLPSPYGYFLPISSVTELEAPDGEQCNWIIFPNAEKNLIVIDDETYRVFASKDGAGMTIAPGEPLVESPHGLGYCPARLFWSTPLSKSEPLVKRSPVTNYLSALDLLLLHTIGNEHLNLYGRYPITWAFAQDCDFTVPDTGVYCSAGYLKNKAGEYIVDGLNVPRVCPVCDERRLNGPGSVIEVDTPHPDNGNANLREPVGHIPIPKESLDYNVSDLERRRAEIFTAVTGYRGMSINDKAVNEKQVAAIFETLETALEKTQVNFERARAWFDETVCRLRYPEGTFVRASISMGTEHYILLPSALLELYKLAKESGFPAEVLDAIEDRYYSTEYRNNPEKLLRHRVLSALDPFRHLTTKETKELFDDGLVRYENFILKANFSSLVGRFERDNMAVTEFAENLEFATKIDRIGEALRRYAEDLRPEAQATPPAPPPAPPPTNNPSPDAPAE